MDSQLPLLRITNLWKNPIFHLQNVVVCLSPSPMSNSFSVLWSVSWLLRKFLSSCLVLFSKPVSVTLLYFRDLNSLVLSIQFKYLRLITIQEGLIVWLRFWMDRSRMLREIFQEFFNIRLSCCRLFSQLLFYYLYFVIISISILFLLLLVMRKMRVCYNSLKF